MTGLVTSLQSGLFRLYITLEIVNLRFQCFDRFFRLRYGRSPACLLSPSSDAFTLFTDGPLLGVDFGA